MLSRRSTGFDGELESLPHLPISFSIGDQPSATRLSARLDTYSTQLGFGPMNQSEPTFSAHAVKAWQSHLSKLTKLEREMFLDHSKGDLKQYEQQIMQICLKRNRESKGIKIAKLFQPWFNVANLYAPVAQTMIQADPTSSSLVLGGLTCIMSINARILEFQEGIMDTLAEMGERIELLNEYASSVYQKDDRIQCAIVDVFADILQFCRLALPLFKDENGNNRGSVHNFFKALKTSFSTYFGDVIKKYHKDIQVFENRALLLDRKDDRLSRLISMEFMQHQVGQIGHIHEGLMSMQQSQMSAIAGGQRYLEFHDSQMRKADEAFRTRQLSEQRAALRNDIVNWLKKSSVDFHEDQSRNIEARTEDTGDWILNHERYVSWRESMQSESLWVHGKRGCGKSVLTSVVVQDLQKSCESDENIKEDAKAKDAFGFIYCTSLQADKYNVSKILCSLVEQLSNQLPKPMINPYLEGIYKRHNGSRPLELEETKEALRSLVRGFRSTSLVIDGLDELRILEYEKFKEQCLYLRSLTEIYHGSTVKLLVLSRPEYSTVQDAFVGCPRIAVDNSANKDDIRKFISKRMVTIKSRFPKSLEKILEIEQQLLERADGMFLWVDRVINDLQGERRVSDVVRRVKEDLPKDLDQQYTNSLLKIVQNDTIRNRALKAILWVANAKRPLRHDELLEALVIEPGMTELEEDDRLAHDTDLCSECENLIVLDQVGGSEYYQLLHSSFKDYLLGEPAISKTRVPEEYSVLHQNADKILAETCITYLSLEQFNYGPVNSMTQFKEIQEAHPFAEYAATQWGVHVVATSDNDLRNSVKDFITIPKHRDLSMKFIMSEEYALYNVSSTALDILAMFDLVDVFNLIKDDDIHRLDRQSAIPLMYAIYNKSRNMVRELITDLKNSQSHQSLSEFGAGLIYLAANNGWAEVVQDLIDLGCDLTTKSSYKNHTPLHAAAKRGSTDVLSVLLQYKIDLDVRDAEGATPLLLACRYNNSDAASTLIEAGANVNLSDLHNDTPIHRAVENKDVNLVQLLHSKSGKSIITNQADAISRTPIYIAACVGAKDILDYIIQQGAEIDIRGPDGLTALHASVSEGHVKCIESLLQAGAKTDLLTDDDRNILHVGAESEQLEALKYLRDRIPEQFCAMLNKVDRLKRTPLHLAMCNETLDVTDFLIEKGALRNTTAISDICPIHGAAVEGQINVIKQLWAKDPTCITWKDRHNGQILHYVAHFGSEYPKLNELILPLLNAGADSAAFTDDYCPLHFAAMTGNLEFAKILFEHVSDLDLNVLSKAQETPLYVATNNDRTNFIDWLLEKGVLLQQPKNIDGNLPMHMAAWNGNLDVLKKMLTSENCNDRGYQGRTALYCASAHGHYDVVRYLLDNKVDPNIANESMRTPVTVSVLQRHVKVANLLIDSGVELSSVSGESCSVLHAACVLGDENLVEKLLNLGCDSLTRDNSGQTPFMYALESDTPAAFELFIARDLVDWHDRDSDGSTHLHLLAAFGSVNRLKRCQEFIDAELIRAVDNLGRNALWHAARDGHAEMLDLLVQLGVPVQEIASVWGNPLHSAASQGHVETVQKLVELRNQVVSIDEASDFDQRTALHSAVLNEKTATTEILIKAGANPLQQDCLGLTVLDYAHRHPKLWERTSLAIANHIPTELGTRMPYLTATITRTLQKLSGLPSTLSTQDTFLSRNSLRLLGNALLEIGTEASVELAMTCYIGFISMPIGLHNWYIDCDVCGQREPPGSKYICPLDPLLSFMCEACYLRNQREDLANTEIQARGELYRLEEEMRLVRRALAPLTVLDVRAIARACELCTVSNAIFDRMQREYGHWSNKHNSDAHFANHKLTGLKFLQSLQKLRATEQKLFRYSDGQSEYRKSSNIDERKNELGCKDGEMEQQGRYSKEVLDEELDQLRDDLCNLFRYSRPDTEPSLLPCTEHKLLELPTIDSLNEEQKKCFEKNGTVTKDWLEKLGEWQKKNLIRYDINELQNSDQPDSAPEGNMTHEGLFGRQISQVIAMQSSTPTTTGSFGDFTRPSGAPKYATTIKDAVSTQRIDAEDQLGKITFMQENWIDVFSNELDDCIDVEIERMQVNAVASAFSGEHDQYNIVKSSISQEHSLTVDSSNFSGLSDNSSSNAISDTEKPSQSEKSRDLIRPGAIEKIISWFTEKPFGLIREASWRLYQAIILKDINRSSIWQLLIDKRNEDLFKKIANKSLSPRDQVWQQISQVLSSRNSSRFSTTVASSSSDGASPEIGRAGVTGI